jgi:hypothetical protein
MERKPWVFTKRRKEALKKAQRKHVEYVKAGERALHIRPK